MPYARVGVIPQSSTNNDRHASQHRSGRKQGITMGDLKKQTALRLAQEQQQARYFPNLTQQRKDDTAILDPQQVVYTGMCFSDPRQQTPQQQMSQQMIQPPGIVYPLSNQGPVKQPLYIASENANIQKKQNASPQGTESKSKLPHGLTVQELKEMTKARLRAENVHETNRSHVPVSYQQQQHFQQQPRHDARTSPYSEHARTPTRGFGPDHMIPSAPVAVPPGFQNQSMPSQNSLSSAPDMTRQSSWQHSAMEAWETGSVDTHNSTINSDYLGSEYAMDEFGEIPFNRSRSYPAAPAGERQYDGHGNLVGNQSYFDQMNNNRRRAVTMSPRTLSHLHEDRPLGSSAAGLGIPFDATSQNTPSFRQSPIRDNGIMEYSGLSSFPGGPNGVCLDGASFTFNRPRTASAPTVSSSYLSHSGDLFGENNRLASLSMDARSNDLPTSMVESLLGVSSNSLHGNTDGFSSVFRSSSLDDGMKNPWGTRNLGGLSGGLPGGSNTVDSDLARELGSVLSLSGIETPPESESRLRNDPEATLFPSLGNNRSSSFATRQTHGMYGNHSSLASGEPGRYIRDQGY